MKAQIKIVGGKFPYRLYIPEKGKYYFFYTFGGAISGLLFYLQVRTRA